MNGYSIFNHAQLGHIQAQDRTKREPAKVRVEVVTNPKPRQRPERGWSVEIGLWLGPRFNKR